ncbi:unnamed protein product, partial [Porites evermanni]
WNTIERHWWFSGRILACHAGGPGSIPGQCKESKIYLVTDFDAILTSRQTCEKLQCLYKNLMSNNNSENFLTFLNISCKFIVCMYRHWWFSGRILACHAGGPVLETEIELVSAKVLRFKSFSAVRNRSFSYDVRINKQNLIELTDFYCSIVILHVNAKHWWFSGRILACHAGGPGSIPG